MSDTKSLICIVCPVGCPITVRLDGKKIESILGNKCRRGREYAESECTNPVRTVTSTVKVLNGELPVAPVKTDKPIPKHLILDCMREINKCTVNAPVQIGEPIIRNILGTEANIIATGNISVMNSL